LDEKLKKQTKAQKFNDLANAIGQIRRGEKVKRIGSKDGSIATHPIVPVDSKKLECEVLVDCLSWLKKHHVMCNRRMKQVRENGGLYFVCHGVEELEFLMRKFI